MALLVYNNGTVIGSWYDHELYPPEQLGLRLSSYNGPATIENIHLYLGGANPGPNTGTFNINIYATTLSGGQYIPTGPSLANYSLNKSELGLGIAEEFVCDIEFTMEEDTMYAMMFSVTTYDPTGTGDSCGIYVRQFTGNDYSKSDYNITAFRMWYDGVWYSQAFPGMWFEINGIPPALPDKAITPGPTDANSGVTLDQENLTWVDGGLGDANEADTFSVYYGDTSGDLTLVSSGQSAGVATNAFIIWELLLGSPFDYAVTRYWRIDSTNGVGTTTGDEWSFTTLTFAPPGPSPPDPDPDDPYPIDYEFDPNFIRTTQRLTLAAGNQFWYEIS